MFVQDASIDSILKVCREINHSEDDVLMLLFSEHDHPDIKQLIKVLNNEGILFFGGIFPGLIHQASKHDSGFIIKAFPMLTRPSVVHELHRTNGMVVPEDWFLSEDEDKKYTSLIFVDGLASNISTFLSGMFNQYGNAVHYLGGGAGSLTLKQQPCIFTNEGFFENAAVVAFLRLESSLGVRHGWQKLMGPMVATKTDKNIVSELNWENAFEAYKRVVEQDAKQSISSENFFDIAKGYPFGMTKEGAESVVRDPLAVNEAGELICVGEVPENTVLEILKGEPKHLIEAAVIAAKDCITFAHERFRHCLTFDCISRVLFLENDFTKELKGVQDTVAAFVNEGVLEGVLTLGEISSYGEGYIEFFNKTIVVGVLYE